MRFLNLSLSLLVAAAILAPITSDAKMITAQTQSGKTVHLQTMKFHGQTMVLLPMDMACDMFKFALCGAREQK